MIFSGESYRLQQPMKHQKTAARSELPMFSASVSLRSTGALKIHKWGRAPSMHKPSPYTLICADRAMHFFEPLLCTFYLTNTLHQHLIMRGIFSVSFQFKTLYQPVRIMEIEKLKKKAIEKLKKVKAEQEADHIKNNGDA